MYVPISLILSLHIRRRNIILRPFTKNLKPSYKLQWLLWFFTASDEMMTNVGSKRAYRETIRSFSFLWICDTFFMNMWYVWYVLLHWEKISRYDICVNVVSFHFNVHSKRDYLNSSFWNYKYIYLVKRNSVTLCPYFSLSATLRIHLLHGSLRNEHFSVSLYYHKKSVATANPAIAHNIQVVTFQ